LLQISNEIDIKIGGMSIPSMHTAASCGGEAVQPRSVVATLPCYDAIALNFLSSSKPASPLYFENSTALSVDSDFGKVKECLTAFLPFLLVIARLTTSLDGIIHNALFFSM